MPTSPTSMMRPILHTKKKQLQQQICITLVARLQYVLGHKQLKTDLFYLQQFPNGILHCSLYPGTAHMEKLIFEILVLPGS